MADLTVTNAYSKGNKSTTLTINGNVEIANYKQGEAKPSAFVQAKVTDGQVSIQSNKGNVSSLDLSDQKYSVMRKIANSSKDDSGAGELSWYDLRDTNKAKLGLDDSFEIKKDLKAGILNIYKKVGNKLTTWLHIDFETQSEKNNQSVKTNNQTVKQTSSSSSRLKPTKEDEQVWGKDEIKMYKNADGSVTYQLPYIQDTDAGDWVANSYTVKNGKIIKQINTMKSPDKNEITYTNESEYYYKNNKVYIKEKSTWGNGETFTDEKEASSDTQKFLYSFANLLEHGSFGKIMSKYWCPTCDD